MGHRVCAEHRGHGGARGIKLLDVVVVLSLIVVLGGFAASSPWLISSRRGCHSPTMYCLANLRYIGQAAKLYAEAHGGEYPWAQASEIEGEGAPDPGASARASLALLYEQDFLDDTELFVCPGSSDRPAAWSDPLAERRERFRLGPDECSYTWRAAPTTTADPPDTPLSGDKRASHHEGGRMVLFRGGHVAWFESDVLQGSGAEARAFRRDLIGFDAHD